MYASMRQCPKITRNPETEYASRLEQIYLTESVKARLNGLNDDVLRMGISPKVIARMLGVGANTLHYYRRRLISPSLKVYLRMARYFGWSIAFDVNKDYAEMTYLPEDILLRWQRVYEAPRLKYCQMSVRIGAEIGEHGRNVYEAITYGYRRTLKVYAKVMLKLSEYEQARKYPDALIFER